VRIRLDGRLGTELAIEGDRIVLQATEVWAVEHHTDVLPKPDGWEMTADGEPVATGPLHYAGGIVELAFDPDHAEQLARGILEKVEMVRRAKTPVPVPRPGILLPEGVRLREDGRQS
jgi:hypothetical protein